MKSISVGGIVKQYDGNPVVKGISFELEAGEFLTLLGPSGCGKTTTLRMIAGLEKLDGGSVSVGGRVLASAEQGISLAPERRGMGMVFQNYAIWPHKTVFKNVSFPLEVRKTPKSEIRTRVLEALDTVGLAGFEDRPAPNLSGGQQQRVALARALVANPDVLLLDEPLSNLDAALREEMRFELKSLQSRLGLTTIFVTHDQSEAMALSDQVIVMNAGRIEQQAAPAAMYERPASRFVMNFLGQVNQLTGRIAAGTDGGLVATIDNGPSPAALPISETDGLSVGMEVAVSFRKEAVGVTVAGEPCHFTGIVTSSIYLGSHAEHLVAIGDSVVRVASASAVKIGDPVSLRVDPSGVRAFPIDAPVPISEDEANAPASMSR